MPVQLTSVSQPYPDQSPPPRGKSSNNRVDLTFITSTGDARTVSGDMTLSAGFSKSPVHRQQDVLLAPKLLKNRT